MQTAVKEHPLLVVDWKAKAINKRLANQTRRPMKVQPSDYTPATVAPQKLRGEAPKHDKPYFDAYNGGPYWCWWDEYDRQGADWIKCPWKVGDHIWFRETWRPSVIDCSCFEQPCDCFIVDVAYAADGTTQRFRDCSIDAEWEYPKAAKRGNVPSIHMPRWACRSVRKITEVRVERVKEISEADAIAEGLKPIVWPDGWQGYRDVSGELLHCQTFSEVPPEWMIDPKPYSTAILNKTAVQQFKEIWIGLYGPDSWENDWCWAITFEPLTRKEA